MKAVKLLEVRTSVRQQDSISSQLSSLFIEAWRLHHSNVQHIIRDVGANPTAMPDDFWVKANYTLPFERTQEMIDPLIHGISLALKSELESNQLGGRVYVDALVTALMAHLLRNYSVKKCTLPFSTSSLPKRKLQQVLDYIHAHLDQDLTLFKLAAIVYMSPSYFSTLFKQSTGLAPHQYIIRYRVERAKQLLLEGKLSVAEISTLVGFTHQSHLSYHFRRRFGSSPKVFMQSQ